MTSFRDRGWDSRYAEGGMGDIAEKKFEAVHKTGWVRTGLNRPPLRVDKLPLRERYRPDYMTSASYIEVQGLGADQKFKLKWEKLNCLLFWNQLHPVVLFVYDSKNDRHTYVPLKQLTEWIDKGYALLKHFREGKAYFEMPADLIFHGSP